MEENATNEAQESEQDLETKASEKEPALSSPKRAGGFLLFLAVVLLLGSLRTMLLELLLFADVDESMKTMMQQFPAINVSFWVYQAAIFGMSIWGLVAAYKLLKVTQDAVKVTKAYLVVFAVYPFVLPFIPMGLTGIPVSMYHSILGFYFSEIVSPAEVGGMIVSSIIWYVYLCRSRRVRETFSQHG